MLPDAVIQGMGWAQPPQQVPIPGALDLTGGVPQTPVALPPPVAPMPAMAGAPTSPPPVDDSLQGAPSAAPALPAPPPAAAPGVQQPPAQAASQPVAPAPAAPRAPVPGAAPQKPPTLAQQQAQATQAQDAADAASKAAVDQGVSAKLDEAAQIATAQQGNVDRQKELEDKRAAFLDQQDKVRATKQKVADDAEKALDNYKVDQNQYWNGLGMGNKIGLYVAMALSGLGSALQGKGGENPVIQMIQQKSREAIIAQQDERDQMLKRLGRARDDVKEHDAFTANREARILLDESQADKMLGKQVALASAKSADANIRAAGAAQAAALDQSSAEKKAAAVERATQHDMQRQNIAIARGQLGIAQHAEQRATDMFQWQKEKDQQEIDLKAAALAAKGDKRGSEEYQKFGIPGVTLKNGEPFIATGEGAGVEKVREKVAATKTMAGIIDQALQIRTGYSNNIVASREEWQRLRQLWASAKAKGKDTLGLGALSESDYALLDGYLGAEDPTSFRDPTAGMLQARQSVLRDLNDTLSAHNRSGQEFKLDGIPSEFPRPAVVTDESRAFKEALAPQATPESVSPRTPYFGDTKRGLQWDASDLNAQKRQLAETGMKPSVKQNLDTWGAMLMGGDEKLAANAGSILERIASTADDAAVKEYAQQLLVNNVGKRAGENTQRTDEPAIGINNSPTKKPKVAAKR